MTNISLTFDTACGMSAKALDTSPVLLSCPKWGFIPTRTGPLTTEPGEPTEPDPMLLVPIPDWPFPLDMDDGIPIPNGLLVLDDPGIAPLPVKEENMEKVLCAWLGFELFGIPTVD